MNCITISIVMCCYNSSKKLEETMGFLASQIVADFSAELIVVDNNSTDGCGAMAIDIWSSYNNPFSLKVFREEIPGQAFARKRGVFESNGRYILFCDDDNHLQENYLQISVSIMRNYKEVGILGGQSFLKTNVSIPAWFKKYEECYAVGKQGIRDGDIDESRNYIWGAGMVVRKEVFADIESCKFINILEGRVGKRLSSGDDSELCLQSVLLGYKLHYSSSLKLFHFITADRLEWKYFLRLQQGISISSFYLSLYNSNEIRFTDFWKKKFGKSLERIARLIPFKSFINSVKGLVIQPEGQLKPLLLKSELSIVFELLFRRRKIKKEFHSVLIMKKSIDDSVDKAVQY